MKSNNHYSNNPIKKNADILEKYGLSLSQEVSGPLKFPSTNTDKIKKSRSGLFEMENQNLTKWK